MSLRPNVSGFSLNIMLDFFGSGDRTVAKKLIEHYREFWEVDGETDDDDDAKASDERSLKFIKAAVQGKIDTRTIKVEDESVIRALIAMANFEQEHTLTDSCDWKYQACADYLEELFAITPEGYSESAWDRVCDELIFLTGRPIFGLEFETDWVYYGYLTKKEVKHLLKAFDSVPSMTQDEAGFGKELKSWLSDIAAKDQDLLNVGC